MLISMRYRNTCFGFFLSHVTILNSAKDRKLMLETGFRD